MYVLRGAPGRSNFKFRWHSRRSRCIEITVLRRREPCVRKHPHSAFAFHFTLQITVQTMRENGGKMRCNGCVGLLKICGRRKSFENRLTRVVR